MAYKKIEHFKLRERNSFYRETDVRRITDTDPNNLVFVLVIAVRLGQDNFRIRICLFWRLAKKKWRQF
jgi:hypothetical protein